MAVVVSIKLSPSDFDLLRKGIEDAMLLNGQIAEGLKDSLPLVEATPQVRRAAREREAQLTDLLRKLK